jgi:hypothetical protein
MECRIQNSSAKEIAMTRLKIKSIILVIQTTINTIEIVHLQNKQFLILNFQIDYRNY